MRSIAFAIQTISSAVEIVRGSSIMNVMSWRRIERNSVSIATSCRMMLAASAASRRAKASSAWRSIDKAMSAAWRTVAKRCRSACPRSWICLDMRAIFVRNHLVDQVLIAVRERVDGAAYLGLHQAAHLQNPRAQGLEVVVVLLGKVFGTHCAAPVSRTGR